MKKFCFIGTSDISKDVLETLWSYLPQLNLAPPLIVTSEAQTRGRGQKRTPNAVEKFAQQKGLSYLTFGAKLDSRLKEKLEQEKVEFILTASCKYWIPESILKATPKGVINLHPSLLPLYRGAAPIQRQLIDGVRETGICLLESVREMDAGPIIAYRQSSIQENEDAVSLLQRLMREGVQLFVESYERWSQGLLKAQPQVGIPSLAPKIQPYERILNPFQQDAYQMHNLIRGLTLNQFARLPVIWRGNPIECLIKKSRVISAKEHTLSYRQKDRWLWTKERLFLRGSNDTTLEILFLSLQNGKNLEARDFINGYLEHISLTPNEKGWLIS